MNTVELLTVEDSFQITGRGVVLVPDFSVPVGWTNRTETVLVEQPCGTRYEALAQFNLSHFNLIDRNAPVDKRWRIVVLLPGLAKEEVPPGSKIFVASEVRDAVISDNTAS
jgi:hypothetical protein